MGQKLATACGAGNRQESEEPLASGRLTPTTTVKQRQIGLPSQKHSSKTTARKSVIRLQMSVDTTGENGRFEQEALGSMFGAEAGGEEGGGRRRRASTVENSRTMRRMSGMAGTGGSMDSLRVLSEGTTPVHLAGLEAIQQESPLQRRRRSRSTNARRSSAMLVAELDRKMMAGGLESVTEG
eukprot:g41.t1